MQGSPSAHAPLHMPRAPNRLPIRVLGLARPRPVTLRPAARILRRSPARPRAGWSLSCTISEVLRPEAIVASVFQRMSEAVQLLTVTVRGICWREAKRRAQKKEAILRRPEN